MFLCNWCYIYIHLKVGKFYISQIFTRFCRWTHNCENLCESVLHKDIMHLRDNFCFAFGYKKAIPAFQILSTNTTKDNSLMGTKFYICIQEVLPKER